MTNRSAEVVSIPLLMLRRLYRDEARGVEPILEPQRPRDEAALIAEFDAVLERAGLFCRLPRAHASLG